MSRYGRSSVALLCCALLLGACQKEPQNGSSKKSPDSAPVASDSAAAISNAHPAMPPGTTRNLSGTVTEALSANSFSYFQLDTGKEKVWITSPLAALKPGEKVKVSVKSPLTNFHSKSLDRDFAAIYFVNEVMDENNQVLSKRLGNTVASGSMGNNATPDPAATPPATMPPMDNVHVPNMATGKLDTDKAVKNIARAKDGKTVSEIITEKKQLVGQAIRIRGKVISYTPNILGKNWIHLKDSSSAQDIILTTNSKVKTGDIIVAKGKLAVDKDYGEGLKYDILLEDVKITVE